MDIIKQIGDAETFEDALEAAKELYAYCKKPQEKQAFNQAPIPNGQSGNPIDTDVKSIITAVRLDDSTRKL